MTVQEYAIHATQKACGELFRAARAVPQDKLEWKPLDTGRSVLDQMREIVSVTAFFPTIIRSRCQEKVNSEFVSEQQAKVNATTSLDELEALCQQNNEQLFAAIREVRDEEVDKEVPHPFGGSPVKLCDVLMFDYWNLIYHYGQVSFIQTLYGDEKYYG